MTKTLKLTRITLNRDVPPHPHPPPPEKKSTPNFYNLLLFFILIMYCDFCAWAICGSKKVAYKLTAPLLNISLSGLF